MAQISGTVFRHRKEELGEYESEARTRANVRGASGRASGAASESFGGSAKEALRKAIRGLRISDVPKPVLIALVILMVVALGMGWLLHDQMGAYGTMKQLGDISEMMAAPSDASDSCDASASARHDALADEQTDAPATVGGEDAQETPPANSSLLLPQEASSSAGGDACKTLAVDVDGAVCAPGVYELPEGSRVIDAIQAAGGLRSDADTSSLNQASPLADGTKIYVAVRGQAQATQISSVSSNASSGVTAEAGQSGKNTAPVNINTADAAALETLPGVGASTAHAIIQERERGGPFASIDDLMRVSGIGEKKLEKLRGMICV